MPRESMKSKRERAVEVCRRMDVLYPAAECALHFHDPFTLVVAVLLSAQTTDVAVNKVTPELFDRWPTPFDLAAAPIEEVERILKPIGFFHSKARHAIDAAQMIVSDFGGEVPSTMEELTRLPGVGRKTANIVLNNAFGIVEGIAVDTHVFRIATRLGFTKAPTPAEAEGDLLAVIPKELWGPVNHQWVLFGRQVCDARKPLCVGEGQPCPLADICPSCGKTGNPTSKTAARKKPAGKKPADKKPAGKRQAGRQKEGK